MREHLTAARSDAAAAREDGEIDGRRAPRARAAARRHHGLDAEGSRVLSFATASPTSCTRSASRRTSSSTSRSCAARARTSRSCSTASKPRTVVAAKGDELGMRVPRADRDRQRRASLGHQARRSAAARHRQAPARRRRERAARRDDARGRLLQLPTVEAIRAMAERERAAVVQCARSAARRRVCRARSSAWARRRPRPTPSAWTA